jgi:hypothetical protein
MLVIISGQPINFLRPMMKLNAELKDVILRACLVIRYVILNVSHQNAITIMANADGINSNLFIIHLSYDLNKSLISSIDTETPKYLPVLTLNSSNRHLKR